MYYEQFLFTRNTRRDFTAFIRPEETSNQDVSVFAGILGYINNVHWLTPQHPAIYCFPIGAYNYLLRHYDSGRQHAGRTIGVLEGIAVKRTRTRTFANQMYLFLAQQDQYLNVISTVPDIEFAQTTQSQWYDLSAPHVDAPTTYPHDQNVIESFATQQLETRLQLPFTDDGKRLIEIALLSSNIPPLIQFAFGTTSDAVSEIVKAGVDLDIVGFFTTTQPSLRNRTDNQLITTFEGYGNQAFTPQDRPTSADTTGDTMSLRQQAAQIDVEAKELYQQASHKSDTQPRKPRSIHPQQPADPVDESMMTPRQMRQRAKELAATNAPIRTDEEAQRAEQALFADEPILTPREMRRKMMEQEAAHAEQEGDLESRNWLISLMRRLFGRS